MIKESLILPSQGFPYKGKLEGTSVVVRPLTTRVYKDFLVNPNEEGVLHLVDSCLVDCPIKAEELVYPDELAIYMKIRAISMGSTLPIYSVCPKCETKNSDTWDIMNLKCKYLSLDEYPIPFILPETKTMIKLSFPTGKTEKYAKEEAQKRASRFNKKIADFLPTFKIASILTVEGVGDIIERSDWYNDLPLKDAMFIDKAIEVIQDFGVQTEKIITCSCGYEYVTPLQITSNFFRPDVGNIVGIKTSTGTLEKGPTDSVETE